MSEEEPQQITLEIQGDDNASIKVTLDKCAQGYYLQGIGIGGINHHFELIEVDEEEIGENCISLLPVNGHYCDYVDSIMELVSDGIPNLIEHEGRKYLPLVTPYS